MPGLLALQVTSSAMWALDYFFRGGAGCHHGGRYQPARYDVNIRDALNEGTTAPKPDTVSGWA